MFCIPILGKNTKDAIELIARASPLADMLEIRLDMMDRFDLHKLIQAADKPVLVTYRSEKEGGRGKSDPEVQSDYLLRALQEGADLVDVEMRLPQRWREKVLDARGRSRVIISTHLKDTTPSSRDLERIFGECASTGADIVKIVTWANTWADNLRVLDLIPIAHDQEIKIIAFCMGPMGRISRVFSHLMGGCLTFASLAPGQESATGQIPVLEMKKILTHFSR
jgi:3-dehydroquinate dehydratase type I